MIYIYIIINKNNNKVYIGSTNNIKARFNEHKRDLNKSIHHNEHLQNAWNKYGSDSFEFKTLMVCPEKERNHCEQMFMDLHNSQNRDYGYNIRDADSHSVSDQTRLKMSKVKSGKNHPMYGKHHSDETKAKMSETNRKDFARITKRGFCGDKQQYIIKFNAETIKSSIDVFKLIDWFFENYQDENLEISMEVLDNALLS